MSRITRSRGSPVSDLDQVADPQLPAGRAGAEEVLHVAPGDLGEVRAPLVGDQSPGRADCPQQAAGQCTRSGACLEHPRAREDVGAHQDLRCVFGVDHSSAARHGHGELVQQRPHREERRAAR